MWLNDLYQQLSPIAFSLGPITVRWYALAYVMAFVLGGVCVWAVSRHWKLGLKTEDIVTCVVGIGFGAVFGARLGYVLFYGNGYYLVHPEHIFAFSEGGMSFHGGLVGAIIGGFVGCKICKMSVATFFDLGCIAAPIGLFLGRLANFVNGELWGKPTELPWGVVFQSAGPLPRHPSQLYEALLEGLALFILLVLLAKKVPARPQGTFAGTFLVFYGVARIAVEFVRVPDVQLGYLFGPVTMGMLLSVPLIVAGVVLLVWAKRTKHPQVGYVSKCAKKQPEEELI